MKRAGVYPRVSTLKQATEGHSLEWQIENLPVMARNNGAVCKEEDIFIEVGSGANDDRPQYNKMMALVMEGYYQEIWVYDMSRLSRTEDRGEVQKIVDAMQKFGCIIRTPFTTFDFNSIEGEGFADMSLIMARMDRQRIKQKMATGKSEKVRKGGYAGGKCPEGYRPAGRDQTTGKLLFEIDPPRAEMVKLAFKLTLQGETRYAVEKLFYEMGYRNEAGNKIVANVITRWLRNPHYAGYTRSKAKGILVENNEFLEPLITKEMFNQVQAIMDRVTVIRDKRVSHPLSGILRCGNCGMGMRVGNVRERRIYECPSKIRKGVACKGDSPKSIKYRIAHQMVIDALPEIMEAVKKGLAVNKAAQRKARQQEAKNENLETTKQDLLKKINNLLSQQENRFSEIREARIAKLENELKQLEKQSASKIAPAQLVIPKDAQKVLKDISPDNIEALHRIVPLFFNKIYFMKRGHFHSGKFEITRAELPTGVTLRLRENGKLYQ